MPIKLHPNCVDRLREQLPEALSAIVITSNHYVDYDSVSDLRALEAVLPQHAEIREQLDGILGRDPLSAFVLDRLHRSLRESLPFESDARSPLPQLALEESIDELADRFVAELITLPWEYAFLYQLPDDAVDPLLQDGRSEFELAPGLAFVRWTSGQQELFELPPGDERGGLHGLLGAPKPTEGSAYLQAAQLGYVPEFGTSSAREEADRTLRATLGLGLASQVWERGWGSGLAGLFGPGRAHVHIWRRTEAGWTHVHPQALPTEVGEAISKLRISKNLEALGPEVTSRWARQRFGEVRVLHASDQGRAIARACRWLFDSYVGSNELLSFIQATVSAEILLGDKAVSDITGLTELLANRCAYLVGESRSQREEILTDFRDIYRTRSRIVHRGLDQLDPDDEDRLWKLRWLCTQVIQKELELLLKD